MFSEPITSEVKHRIVTVQTQDLSDTLNDLEVDGWEFCAFSPCDDNKCVSFIVKRVKMHVGHKHNWDTGPM